MICPVCLDEVSAATGVVETHSYAHGKVCPMSGKEPFRWDERSVRAAVPNRSGGTCETCGSRGMEMHHRLRRSQTGLWRPANILHLCGECHRFFTVKVAFAEQLGVSVRYGVEPANVGVRTYQGVIFLSDDIAPPLPSWLR